MELKLSTICQMFKKMEETSIKLSHDIVKMKMNFQIILKILLPENHSKYIKNRLDEGIHSKILYRNN